MGNIQIAYFNPRKVLTNDQIKAVIPVRQKQVSQQVGPVWGIGRSISGAIPLLMYLQGLRLTRPSTAGYFRNDANAGRRMHHLGLLPRSLHPHQAIGPSS